MSVRLQTDRLIVRAFEPRDGEPWVAMLNAPGFDRFLPPGPVATLEVFRSGTERRHAMERDCAYTMWAVELKETGAFVGQCGLVPVERTGPEIELAYHFDKASWNKGYATEAAIAVLGYGLGSIGLDRVMAVVMPENFGSCRVAEKAGMRFEGIATYYGIAGLRKYVAERGRWSPPLRSRVQ